MWMTGRNVPLSQRRQSGSRPASVVVDMYAFTTAVHHQATVPEGAAASAARHEPSLDEYQRLRSLLQHLSRSSSRVDRDRAAQVRARFIALQRQLTSRTQRPPFACF